MASRLRVLTVFGTRPEAIKMAPVARALESCDRIEHRLCVTGQHRRMLDQVLACFDLHPHHDLDLMRPGQDLWDLTRRVLAGTRRVLCAESPDLVLVHGDTTTTFAATLSAFYAHVPVGHVEAGLRTGDLAAPFPEEANRVLTDRLSDLLFAPTERARQALLDEGIPEARIRVTGNTIVDALRIVHDHVMARPLETWREDYGRAFDAIARPEVPIVLVTGHRRENLGPRLDDVCTALARLATRNPGVHLIYPVHPNPGVRDPVTRLLAGLPNVHLTPPLAYEPFVRLMVRCRFVLTDSGGIQEEAPSLGRPVLVMRDVTERPEGVAAGTARVVGTDPDRIVEESERLLTDPTAWEAMAKAHNPFGDGQASRRILDAVLERLG